MATSPVTFLKETQAELQKVTWPSRSEVVRLTAVVILVSLIIGLFLGGVDALITRILQQVIK